MVSMAWPDVASLITPPRTELDPKKQYALLRVRGAWRGLERLTCCAQGSPGGIRLSEGRIDAARHRGVARCAHRGVGRRLARSAPGQLRRGPRPRSSGLHPAVLRPGLELADPDSASVGAARTRARGGVGRDRRARLWRLAEPD